MKRINKKLPVFSGRVFLDGADTQTRRDMMWHSVRLWLKVVLGFLFSITLLISSLTYALFGAKEKDTVELIITEATGVQKTVVLFAGKFQPLIIHNVFWLSLVVIGFLLIFLYFIDHSFKAFLAPGIICVIIFIVISLMVSVAQSFIFDYTAEYGDLFIDTSFSKLRLASFVILALGAALIGTSYWSEWKKNKQNRSKVF